MVTQSPTRKCLILVNLTSQGENPGRGSPYISQLWRGAASYHTRQIVPWAIEEETEGIVPAAAEDRSEPAWGIMNSGWHDVSFSKCLSVK